jgi:hypothetical protein
MRIFVCLLFIPFFSFSQQTHWAKSFGGVESDKGISIGTDSLGYVYISGYFNTEADLAILHLLTTTQPEQIKKLF